MAERHERMTSLGKCEKPKLVTCCGEIRFRGNSNLCTSGISAHNRLEAALFCDVGVHPSGSESLITSQPYGSPSAPRASPIFLQFSVLTPVAIPSSGEVLRKVNSLTDSFSRASMSSLPDLPSTSKSKSEIATFRAVDAVSFQR